MAVKLKIRSKDRVIVVSGKDKGKIGEVIKVLVNKQKVIVQGVNIVKRHRRASRASRAEIVEKEAAVAISNVAHLDPRTNLPTRIGYKKLADGRKVRYAKRSQEIIDI